MALRVQTPAKSQRQKVNDRFGPVFTNHPGYVGWTFYCSLEGTMITKLNDHSTPPARTLLEDHPTAYWRRLSG